MSKEEQYLERSLARIQALFAGSCIGANLMGLGGREYHHENGNTARQILEKEVMKLYKYAKKIKSDAQH